MNHKLTDHGFLQMKRLIEQKCGILIDKEKAYLIESRLSGLLSKSGFSGFEDFLETVLTGRAPDIAERMIDAMTTNETMWFRDQSPWPILECQLMPSYIEALRQGKKDRIRIWSTGCSTGQEPYSLAMAIDRYLTVNHVKDISLGRFDILATDISNVVLETAKAGQYDHISITRGLTDEYRTMYFTEKNKIWHIQEKIRDAVRFKLFNLQNDFTGLGEFDLILCRYTLIYFSDLFKKEVLEKIHRILLQDGFLVIGGSELMPEPNEYFLIEQYENGVIYRRKG